VLPQGGKIGVKGEARQQFAGTTQTRESQRSSNTMGESEREGMNSNAARFGFTDTEWKCAKKEALRILSTTAAKRGMIPYGDLAREVTSIRFEPHQSSLWWLIGEISEDEDKAGHGMLSVIVVHKHGDMEPGTGFFELAENLGRDVTDRTAFWVSELHQVHGYWSNRTKK
jgi:hypothetical protein